MAMWAPGSSCLWHAAKLRHSWHTGKLRHGWHTGKLRHGWHMGKLRHGWHTGKLRHGWHTGLLPHVAPKGMWGQGCGVRLGTGMGLLWGAHRAPPIKGAAHIPATIVPTVSLSPQCHCHCPHGVIVPTVSLFPQCHCHCPHSVTVPPVSLSSLHLVPRKPAVMAKGDWGDTGDTVSPPGS